MFDMLLIECMLISIPLTFALSYIKFTNKLILNF